MAIDREEAINSNEAYQNYTCLMVGNCPHRGQWPWAISCLGVLKSQRATLQQPHGISLHVPFHLFLCLTNIWLQNQMVSLVKPKAFLLLPTDLSPSLRQAHSGYSKVC